MKGSIFTLVAICLGMGTVTLPSVAQQNGIIVGLILVLFGAVISWYTGMLIIACAEQTNTDKYEDLALEAYGPRMAKVTSWCVIANLLGFVISNIVYIKTLVPHTLEILIWGSTEEAEGQLPSFMGNGQWTGQLFWATTYCIVVIIPLSLSRNMSAL